MRITPQQRIGDGTMPAIELTERRSWRRRDTGATALRRVEGGGGGSTSFS
jgi:hypothetical protein